jgi:LysM repeat protein
MKTKLLRFPGLKRKKLRATAARRPLRIATAGGYDDIAEPNMKLSRALLIVLLLHIVAVAGIIAFNAIKTRQGSVSPIAAATKPLTQNVATATKPSTPNSPATKETDKSPRLSAKSGTKDSKLPQSSGKTYAVAKGDNPVTIAKKLKVSYDDLLAINHIDDPKKLQIGQKLLIPNKSAKGKKDE